MLNLLMAPMDRDLIILKVKEKKIPQEQLKHINNLGFIEGSDIRVVSESMGNLIVIVKGSRVAIGKDVAAAFMVGEKEWL